MKILVRSAIRIPPNPALLRRHPFPPMGAAPLLLSARSFSTFCVPPEGGEIVRFERRSRLSRTGECARPVVALLAGIRIWFLTFSYRWVHDSTIRSRAGIECGVAIASVAQQ